MRHLLIINPNTSTAVSALLQTHAQRAAGPDAVLIGCFSDPGLLTLQDSSALPVTGVAEAAFVEAAAYGRFAIVTGRARWQPILARLAQMLGYGDQLAGIHTVTPTGAQLAADPVAAQALLAVTAGPGNGSGHFDVRWQQVSTEMTRLGLPAA